MDPITLPNTNISSQVYNAYAPAYNTGVKQIQRQGDVARNDMFEQINKRGVLPSYLMPNASIGLNQSIMDAIAGLNAEYGTAMAGTQLTLDEAKRKEQKTQDFGLLTTALSFLSPIAGDLIGKVLNGGQDERIQGILDMLMQNTNQSDWDLTHSSGLKLSMPDMRALSAATAGGGNYGLSLWGK